jgi:hypothetical protein
VCEVRFFVLFVLLVFPALAAEKLNVQKELAYRVEFGSEADIKMLLEKGGDSNGVNELGWPLVSIAARRVDGQAVPIVKLLVAAGARLDAGGPSRQYPIIIAARNGDAELARYLLDQGVDPEVRDRNGVQPLEIAEYYGHEEVRSIFAELKDKRAAAHAAMRSDARFRTLRYSLVYESCVAQYMHYYFKSGQDKFPKEYQEKKMTEIRDRIQAATADLYQIFRVSLNEIKVMRIEGARPVYLQLEELISNRNRRKHGVGKESDMKRRCTEIAEKWQKTQDAKAAPRLPMPR